MWNAAFNIHLQTVKALKNHIKFKWTHSLHVHLLMLFHTWSFPANPIPSPFRYRWLNVVSIDLHEHRAKLTSKSKQPHLRSLNISIPNNSLSIEFGFKNNFSYASDERRRLIVLIGFHCNPDLTAVNQILLAVKRERSFFTTRTIV